MKTVADLLVHITSQELENYFGESRFGRSSVEVAFDLSRCLVPYKPISPLPKRLFGYSFILLVTKHSSKTLAINEM